MIHPQLAVKDVDASVAFYTEKLGFNHDFSMPDADGKNGFAWVSLGKSGFGLMLDSSDYPRGKGVVFMVGVPDDYDLDEYYAAVKKRGVEIKDEIKTEVWGDRTFTVHDPNSFVISLVKTVQQVPLAEIEAVMRGEKYS